MTSWLPDLEGRSGPLYSRIADSIAAAIDSGALRHGDKLPPQRNLAFDIKVTIGTVSRAYALARERGLVTGEIGRGTYVCTPASSDSAGLSAPINTGQTKGVPDRAASAEPVIRLDSTAAPDVGQASIIDRHLRSIAQECPSELVDYIRAIPPSWEEAGSVWLSGENWRPDPGDVVPTLGVHAAAMAIIAAVTAPGDRIAMEELSYASIARAATVIGRRVATVAADSDGFDPAEFESVCAQQHPRLAFLSTSTANPTGITLSASRRAAIAEIASRHNVWLIDDLIYDSLSHQPIPPLASFAPEKTFTLGGLSKSVASGVRSGWAACPPHMAERVLVAQKLITGGKPFMIAELAARLVLSGDAEQIRDRVRDDVAERVRLADAIFPEYNLAANPYFSFLWLELPEPWRSSEFRHAAARAGVLIDDEDEFKTARLNKTFYRFRLGLTQPPDHRTLKQGLAVLRRIIDSGATAHDSYA